MKALNKLQEDAMRQYASGISARLSDKAVEAVKSMFVVAGIPASSRPLSATEMQRVDQIVVPSMKQAEVAWRDSDFLEDGDFIEKRNLFLSVVAATGDRRHFLEAARLQALPLAHDSILSNDGLAAAEAALAGTPEYQRTVQPQAATGDQPDKRPLVFRTPSPYKKED